MNIGRTSWRKLKLLGLVGALVGAGTRAANSRSNRLSHQCLLGAAARRLARWGVLANPAPPPWRESHTPGTFSGLLGIPVLLHRALAFQQRRAAGDRGGNPARGFGTATNNADECSERTVHAGLRPIGTTQGVR